MSFDVERWSPLEWLAKAQEQEAELARLRGREVVWSEMETKYAEALAELTKLREEVQAWEESETPELMRENARLREENAEVLRAWSDLNTAWKAAEASADWWQAEAVRLREERDHYQRDFHAELDENARLREQNERLRLELQGKVDSTFLTLNSERDALLAALSRERCHAQRAVQDMNPNFELPPLCGECPPCEARAAIAKVEEEK